MNLVDLNLQLICLYLPGEKFVYLQYFSSRQLYSAVILGIPFLALSGAYTGSLAYAEVAQCQCQAVQAAEVGSHDREDDTQEVRACISRYFACWLAGVLC